ncbi:MAG TPA: UDP-2,3-diacylglucosamine diphosphatase LpxI [Alphaproteobacteria bacterium]|nr:UDP-2,3-diacylglucosamine diphosphatase LpxI [Alphaproteobacteria bacterium]
MDSSHSLAPRLGIIAGGGAAPGHLVAACRRLGRDFFVICLEGQAEKGFAEDAPHAWLPLGAGSRLKELSAAEGLRELVMIGRVRRPSLLELKPDWLALKVLTKIGINMLGDDALLRGIGKAIEEETGLRVIGLQEIFADLLAPAGQLGLIAPDDQAQSDIRRGFEIARALGALDVGQSVVVQQGLVLGVEAIEGTDALIARSKDLCREGPGGVLVKIAKPRQDNRFDLPTIGPETITALEQAGLRGVAVEAGRSLLIEREETIRRADAAGFFVIGITPDADAVGD